MKINLRKLILQQGFTLAETIIATSVSLVIIMVLFLILVNNTDIFYLESTKIQQGLNVNNSLGVVRSTIKEAESVAASYVSGPSTYASSQTELVLELYGLKSNGDIDTTITDYAIFTKLQDKLYFKIFKDVLSFRKTEDKILSTNVKSIRFNYLDSLGAEVTPTSAVRVRISLIVEQKAGRGVQIQEATSEGELRNN